MSNPLNIIDETLKEDVLDLFEPVKKAIDHNEPRPAFDYYELVPDYGAASEEIEEIENEMTARNRVKCEEIHQLWHQLYRQQEAIARLYMAFGFLLGARLGGATEEKIEELMNVYSFGLAEQTNRGAGFPRRNERR